MLKDIDVDLPIIGRATLKWPVDDLHMVKWIHLVEQVNEVLSYTEGRGVCVQAGGACGLWPLALSKFFDTVYTFEPYAPNFKALMHNCKDAKNIIARNAALGKDNGTVGIKWDKGHEKNLGAQYISDLGEIPMLTIDSLCLDALDLLFLDIEGAEGLAIDGAEKTIKKYRPVVVYEDSSRQWCKRFGYTPDGIERFFLDLGYNRASNLSRGGDALMVPQ
jgi:FkbM family methyltransferase